MTHTATDAPSSPPIATTGSASLRLWPGVIALVLLWLARFGLKLVIPGFKGFSLAMMSSMALAVLVVLWWLFLSRAPWSERFAILTLMFGSLAASFQLKHESMGPLWLVGYALPLACFALVVGVALGRRFGTTTARRATIAAALVLSAGLWTLVRTEGINGDHVAKFAWRWSPTAEARLLSEPTVPLVADGRESTPHDESASGISLEPNTAAWPGFRGAHRDGVVHGVSIVSDWSKTPPVELWRQPVGPAWSSFAVSTDRFYTQEQRGEAEVVSCYLTATGDLVWQHLDPERFFESNAGAGPRATPSIAHGMVFSFGAKGLLNALDATTGARRWSRQVADDVAATVPDWGFTSSPLVLDDLVIVDAGGLVAYDVTNGEQRWQGPRGSIHYDSAQLFTIEGTPQIVLNSSQGTLGVSPHDGSQLWAYDWPGLGMVQPAQTADGDLLVGAGAGIGMRRFSVRRQAEAWEVKERWASIRMKPYFNDFVVHKGHVYGFDDRILAALDVNDGSRMWKGGRYGNGQMILLAEQDLLLVLTEQGELALVSATPEAFKEIARHPAIEGKTWNHPVLTGDILLVRNAQEMAAFRLLLTP